jgi:DNA-binding FadR family transcriptional regulator
MKNLKSKKLYLKVYEELRKHIIENNLKPGDKLTTEKEMAEELGVSRNVLREAIKTLEIIGVISSKPGVGMVVNSFNPNFLSNCIFINLLGDSVDLVVQSQEVRKVLEMGFSRQCFDTITPQQIAKLHEYIDRMKNSKASDNFYGIDAEFHRTMYENVDNMIFIAFIDSAWECDRNFRATFVEDNLLRVEKHTRIVDALEKRDFPAFQDALTYHFSYRFKEKTEMLLDEKKRKT